MAVVYRRAFHAGALRPASFAAAHAIALAGHAVVVWGLLGFSVIGLTVKRNEAHPAVAPIRPAHRRPCRGVAVAALDGVLNSLYKGGDELVFATLEARE